MVKRPLKVWMKHFRWIVQVWFKILRYWDLNKFRKLPKADKLLLRGNAEIHTSQSQLFCQFALDLSKNTMKHTQQKWMKRAKKFAGISETVGVQQGREGRSVFIFISSTFFSFSRFFHLYFSLTSWLIFCCRNVLEDSFLPNTIPEFDPTPPRVRIVLEIKINLMRWFRWSN